MKWLIKIHCTFILKIPDVHLLHLYLHFVLLFQPLLRYGCIVLCWLLSALPVASSWWMEGPSLVQMTVRGDLFISFQDCYWLCVCLCVRACILSLTFLYPDSLRQMTLTSAQSSEGCLLVWFSFILHKVKLETTVSPSKTGIIDVMESIKCFILVLLHLLTSPPTPCWRWLGSNSIWGVMAVVITIFLWLTQGLGHKSHLTTVSLLLPDHKPFRLSAQHKFECGTSLESLADSKYETLSQTKGGFEKKKDAGSGPALLQALSVITAESWCWMSEKDTW